MFINIFAMQKQIKDINMAGDFSFTLDDLNMSDVANQTNSVETPQEGLTNIPDKEETPENNSTAEEIIDDKGNTELPNQEDITPPNEEDDKSKVPSSNDDNISVFAKAFKEEGLLQNLTEEELKGINSFTDAIKYIQEEANSKAYENLTPTQKRYMDSLNSGVPINEFEELEKELQGIEVITEDILKSDPYQQFTVLALDLIEQGVNSELAQEMANLMVNKPDALSKALQARETLYAKKLEKYNSKVNEKKEDNRLSVEKTKELVSSKENILGKVALSKADKDKIFSKMTTRVDFVDGQQVNEFAKWRLEKGAEAEFILNAIMHLTDNFTSLGKLGITAKSTAAKELEEKLRQTEHKEFTNTSNDSDGNPYKFNF